MLTDMTVKDFLKELASNSPAPGGGSVSALAGGLSTALVSMVARLTAGNGEGPRQDGDVETILEKAAQLMANLERDVDDDTAAFNCVMAAYHMPKQTDQEKEKRSQVIQDALKGAALHPLKVARECLHVLRLCRWAVAHGNPNALSDAGVASLLAQSGIRGAVYNVEINLSGIRDAEFKERMTAEKEEILTEALKLQEEIKELLHTRLS